MSIIRFYLRNSFSKRCNNVNKSSEKYLMYIRVKHYQMNEQINT